MGTTDFSARELRVCVGKPLNPTDFYSMLAWFTVPPLGHGKCALAVKLKSLKFLEVLKKKYFSRVFILYDLVGANKGTNLLSCEFSLSGNGKFIIK